MSLPRSLGHALRLRRHWPIVPALVLAAASAAGATDLTGHWHVASATPGIFADIVQSGTAISVIWTENSTTVDFEGTFDGTFLSATSTTSSSYNLALAAVGAGDVLDGQSGIGFTVTHRYFTRCECFDGDAEDGDGCDSECRIEPCFACAGEPSVCTPSADAASCDDRNDCTQGETCSAGICGGGCATPSCVNLTGIWRDSVDLPDFGFHHVSQLRFIQRMGVVEEFGTSQDPGEVPSRVGTIDTATGTINLVKTVRQGFCAISSDFTGTAALDNLTFSGSGHSYSSPPHGCVSFSSSEQGARCDVSGCDLSDCTGLPDGFNCDDGDDSTTDEICHDEICQSGGYACPACFVYSAGEGCVVGPRTDCHASMRSSSSKLQISDKSPDDKDKLRWQWKNGEATNILDFGDPATTSEIALCIFDVSTDPPSRLFQAVVPPAGSCLEPPCWNSDGEKVSYKDTVGNADGITAISMRTGDDGQAMISVAGKGAGLAASAFGLPHAALPSMLRAQLQVSSGACFDTQFDADGTSRNLDGQYLAKGGAR